MNVRRIALDEFRSEIATMSAMLVFIALIGIPLVSAIVVLVEERLSWRTAAVALVAEFVVLAANGLMYSRSMEGF